MFNKIGISPQLGKKGIGGAFSKVPLDFLLDNLIIIDWLYTVPSFSLTILNSYAPCSLVPFPKNPNLPKNKTNGGRII